MTRGALATLLIGSTIMLGTPIDAAGQTETGGDRWSGRWDLEGDSNEDGVFEHFGVLKLTLVTDGSVNFTEPDWATCIDSDRDYLGTYKFGGGGSFWGCESSEHDTLFLRYEGNDGKWGQANATYVAGSPEKFEGFYSPPTDGTRGEFAYLKWRGTKLPPTGCAAVSQGFGASRAQEAEKSCSDPVIFVPGFLGTVIECPRFGGQLWPDEPSPEFENMQLSNDGESNKQGFSRCNREARPGDVVFKAFTYDVYGGMRKFLNSLPSIKSYFYPYDWRKSPGFRATQKGLDDLVDKAIKESGRDKVTLVAHSMGGLVSRWYVKNHADKVARVVTLATPYWGAPKPWLALAHGLTTPPNDSYAPDLDTFIPDRDLKKFARNAAGAYHLYPSQAYYDNSALGGWLSLATGEVYRNAETTITAVGTYKGNELLYREALGNHTKILDSYAGGPALNWQIVVGTGIPTLFKIDERPETPDNPGYTYANGDGTVPLLSAGQGFTDTEAYVHYVCNVEHASMPGNAAVQELIKDFILTGGAIGNPNPGGCELPAQP